MAKTIEINVDKEGNVSVDAHGYHGVGCSAVTKLFTDVLGKVTSEVVKREMYEKEPKVVITH